MKSFGFIILLIVAGLHTTAAQTAAEKVPVEFIAANLGKMNTEIYTIGNEAYIPVVSLFTALGIKAEYDSAARRVHGFYVSTDTTYQIDISTGIASFQKQQYRIGSGDYYLDGNVLYIRTSFLKTMFGLDFKFKPRRLTLELAGTGNLPASKMAIRKRSIQLRQQREASIPEPDEFLGREFRPFGSGRLNWVLNSQFLRTQFLSTRYDLNLGAQVLGGDFTGRLFGFITQKMPQTNFRGQLRYPFFSTPMLTQIILGDFATNGVRPSLLTGIEVTNRPLAPRYLFSKEVYHGQFEPDVDVELDALGSGSLYQRTNEAGDYQFDVPEIYGHGNVEIHAYDAFGQERILRYRINLPTSLIPPGTIEYSAALGKTRRIPKTLVSTQSVEWGVSSALTMGAKIEYLDLATSSHVNKLNPAFTAVARITKGMIFSALASPTAFSQLSVQWEFPSSASLNVSAIQYPRNSFYNPTELKKSYELTFLQPLKIRGGTAGINFFGSQSIAELYRLRELQVSLNAAVGRVQPTIGTQAEWRLDYGKSSSILTQQSIASIGVFMPADVFFKAQGIYNHLMHRVESFNVLVAKRFPNSFQVLFTYDKLPPFQTYSVGLRVAYYFPMMRAQVGASTSGGNRYIYTANASGSIDYDSKNFSPYFSNTINRSGTGGIILQPFYDVNNNKVRDEGEESIGKSKIFVANHTRGAKPHAVSSKASVLSHLPGYEEYDVYLDPKSLENPLWVPDNGSFRVLSEPNYVKRLDIPIVDGGTVRGAVQIKSASATTPAERIKIKLTSLAGEPRRRLLTTSTFSTGEFEFIAVPPGRYELSLDQAQLDELGYNAQPATLQFEIIGKTDGDVVEKQDFILISR